MGIELTGATVGIIGLGAIGQAVARRLAGFEVRILGYDVSDVEPLGIVRAELDELLRAADVVTLHVPLLPSTRMLIGARELALMRSGAILVNASRGGIVDEEALLQALREKRLAGAGLDVFAREPPVGSALLELSQVVVSPHIAGISVSAQQAGLEAAVEAVVAALAGRRPGGLINPEALASQPSGALD
jgi:phosphoglycerate dehydrogenase-like enzyme